jgi:protein SCO1/2
MSSAAPVNPDSNPRPLSAATLAALVATLVCVAMLWIRVGDNEVYGPRGPEFEGLWWPDPPLLTPFQLTDQDGRELTERNLRGAWTLLFFGYTHCPDVCPTTLALLVRARKALVDAPVPLRALKVLFVSVDARRDSPEVLARYVRHFDAGFLDATAPMEELHLLTRQLDADFVRVSGEDPDVYWYEHSASIFLVAPDLRIVAEFTPPFDAPTLATRVRAICRFIDAQG